MMYSHKVEILGGLVYLVLVAVVFYLLYRRINRDNAQKYSGIGAMLASLVAIPALFFVGYQALQLKRQIELEHRPYLYVYLASPGQPRQPGPLIFMNKPEEAWFGGGDLFFRNVGKDPATIIDSQYMVASDRLGDTHFDRWFKEAYGGFPDVGVVMPGQEDAHVPCHPIIAPADKRPRLMYVGAVITYTGPSAGRKYWFKFSQLFIISKIEAVKDDKGNIAHRVTIERHKPDHAWDQNENSDPPKLVEPNWQDYLSRSYIKTLTEQ